MNAVGILGTPLLENKLKWLPNRMSGWDLLEHDEDGNRISWLRSKERFEIDLAAGEEFRQIDGKWKLY